MADVTLRKVIKRYDDVEAVRGIDLDIADHEFVVLVGPSGCGKSTTLRMIAGLEDITGGDIMIGGDVVNDVPPKDRDIAMVFQNYALYPHMTSRKTCRSDCASNAIRKPRSRPGSTKPRACWISSNWSTASPSNCRVASVSASRWAAPSSAIQSLPVRRAAVQPRRQASGADADRNQESTSEGPHHHVYVTHDQVEAMTLADRVVVMNHGRIEQIGTPNDLYHNPATRFVAGFIGSPAMNFMPAAGGRRR